MQRKCEKREIEKQENEPLGGTELKRRRRNKAKESEKWKKTKGVKRRRENG